MTSKEHKPIFAEDVVSMVSDSQYAYYSPQAAAKIAQAKRFVLTDEALDAALDLIRHKPEVLLQMTHMARLPFPLMWIEYNGKRRYYADDPEFPCSEEDKPDRVGYLIEATNNTMTEGKASMFQGANHPKYGFICATSLFAWAFDYGDVPNPEHHVKDWLCKPMFMGIREREKRNTKVFFKYKGMDISDAQIEDLYRRDIRVPSDYANRFLQMVRFSDKINDPQFDRLVGVNISGMRGDNFLLRAILAMMNSKKNMQYEDVEYDPAFMRSRQKKGRSEWLSHSVIKFGFSDHQKARMRAAGMNEAQIRAHFRRGHWKNRKTGVFWWNPHFAGSLDFGMVDSDYEVND